MKYIIVENWITYDLETDAPQIETKVHLTTELDVVRATLDTIQSCDHDWSVFEQVDDKAIRRSVTFHSTVSLG